MASRITSVRSNAHRDLKSDDGIRRIHLSVLLLADELEVNRPDYIGE